MSVLTHNTSLLLPGLLRLCLPLLAHADKYYPGQSRCHAYLSPDQLPLSKSLLDCMGYTKPLWLNKMAYKIACGINAIVVAHANTLRGLMKIINGIRDNKIQDVAIPAEIPVAYSFDKDLNPIPPKNDQKMVTQVHMKGGEAMPRADGSNHYTCNQIF